jgi:VWFA-related protein
VIKYAEAPQGILDFTTDKPAAAASFEQLHFNLGFGSLNLSSSVSNVLEWLTQVRGKKTIVLLSTGVDTSAVNERAKMLQQLKSGDVRLLAVSLAGGLQDSPPGNKKKTAAKNPAQPAQQFAQANELLKQMAEATGGRAYFPANEKEFSAAYAEIAQLVRHEYSLAFTPPVRDGAVHSIEVRIGVPQTATPKAGVVYRLDHRRAYVAPAPQ